MDRAEHDAADVRRYVRLQARSERISHVEKLKTETVLGQRHEAWDVRTNKDRYWVITNPTNLYSQGHFPSLDYTLSFHIGLTARIASRQAAMQPEEQTRIDATWRRLSQASRALDEADEAEDFQAVGMRCRECLLELIREAGRPEILPAGVPLPKAADFESWIDHIANAVAAGRSNERLRAYLKATATAAWDLVQWLTHARNAVRLDAEISIDATRSAVAAFAHATTRAVLGGLARCPRCRSYRLSEVYRPHSRRPDPYVKLCESCGWTDPPRRSAGG